MKYFSRDKTILRLAENQKVLHLGCVGFADMQTSDRVRLAKESLHYSLSNIAYTTGVDYSRDAIDFFRSNGVFDNVIYGNAEKLEEVNIGTKFDIVIAGDIIEHLSNPGLMLDGIKRFAQSDTSIIITTPHAFGLISFFRYCLGRFVEGKEHVMSFNVQNISNLLVRHGYKVVSIDTCYQRNAEARTFFIFGKSLFRLMPKLGGTLFVVAKINLG
jgi:2-polyprenyl-3-methyl-5-hydroxy-6-metoxy-1,4-benzoquinol methylase